MDIYITFILLNVKVLTYKENQVEPFKNKSSLNTADFI